MLGDGATPIPRSSLNNLGATAQPYGRPGRWRDPTSSRPWRLAARCWASATPIPRRASSNLGYLLHAQGDLAAARPYFEQALAITRKVLGDGPPRYRSQPEQSGLPAARPRRPGRCAIPTYERALAINREVLGERHPDTASSLNNLGELLHAQGDLAAARYFTEQALAIRHARCWASATPTPRRSLNNLGYLLRAQGDADSARVPTTSRRWQSAKRLSAPTTKHSASCAGHLEAHS